MGIAGSGGEGGDLGGIRPARHRLVGLRGVILP